MAKTEIEPNVRRATSARMVKWLANPWILLACLLLGIYLGIARPSIATLMYPVADLYVELLKMVLIPFMISAIVISLARLFAAQSMNRRIGQILLAFLVSTGGVASFGVLSAVLLSPGANISDSSRQTLGHLINSSPYAVDLEITLDEPSPQTPAPAGETMIGRLVPDNIFQALTLGDNLKILFFAITFGIGLGSLHANKGIGLLEPLASVYDICTKIISWVNLLLPFALCAMVAKQVATVGADQLIAMLRFTLGFAASSVLICVTSVVITSFCARRGLGDTIQALRQPALIAIATRSSIACIPTSIGALVEGLGYDRSRIELMMPLGVTLFRFGPILYYAFATLFVAQLYGVQTPIVVYALIILGSILTGLASAGTTGVLTISLLGVIFQPLGLPLEAALALLVTIDPVIDIFRTLAIVIPNCAIAAFINRDVAGGDARRVDLYNGAGQARTIQTSAAPDPAE